MFFFFVLIFKTFFFFLIFIFSTQENEHKHNHKPKFLSVSAIKMYLTLTRMYQLSAAWTVVCVAFLVSRIHNFTGRDEEFSHEVIVPCICIFGILLIREYTPELVTQSFRKLYDIPLDCKAFSEFASTVPTTTTTTTSTSTNSSSSSTSSAAIVESKKSANEVVRDERLIKAIQVHYKNMSRPYPIGLAYRDLITAQERITKGLSEMDKINRSWRLHAPTDQHVIWKNLYDRLQYDAKVVRCCADALNTHPHFLEQYMMLRIDDTHQISTQAHKAAQDAKMAANMAWCESWRANLRK